MRGMKQTVSRRGLLRAAIALAAASGRLASPAHAEAEPSEADKITHANAHYQLVPNGQQRCAICLQFQPPGRCRIVRAPIYPKGWCQYFAARENAH